MGSSLLYMLHKPYGVLSQFTDEGRWQGLSCLALGLARDVYPIGRLDADSEGLLLLTNDNKLKTSLLDPKEGHTRTYHVQVEGTMSCQDLEMLERPMRLTIKGKSHVTRGCKAQAIHPNHPARNPPIRYRANIPDSWIELRLNEGKNRQVRRMTASLGYPTLRLIRVGMGPWTLGELQPGECRQLNVHETNC